MAEELPPVDVWPDQPSAGQPAAPAAPQPEAADPWAPYFAPTQTPKEGASVAADPWAQHIGSGVEDILKSALSSPVKGAIGIMGAPGDVAEVAQRGVDYLLPPPKGIPRAPVDERLPKSRDIRRAVEETWTGPLHDATTPLGKLTETVGEMLPGALGTGGAVGVARKGVEQLKNVGRFAVVPGVAAETAGNLSPEELRPYTRAAGGMAAGGVAAATTGTRSAAKMLSSQLPEYVTPQHVLQAGSLVRSAEAQGVQLTWPEALSQVTGRNVLLDTQRLLESSARTRSSMEDRLGGRPEEVVNAADRAIERISPRAPNPDVVGPQAGRAAEEALNDVRQIINHHAEQFYTAAAPVRLSPSEWAAAQRIPGFAEALADVRSNPHLNRHVANLPDDSIGVLNEVKKRLDTQAENAGHPLQSGHSKQVEASLKTSAADTKQLAIDASFRQSPWQPDYAIALDIERQARQQFLEPLMQGPIGRLAKSDITTQRAIEALFPKNPLAGTADNVHTAVSALVQRNPEAARALVRAHIEAELDKAINGAGRSREAQGFIGAQMAHNVTGNSQLGTQRLANIQAAVEALPNGQHLWEGLDRMFEVMRATGNRMPIGSRTAFNQADLEALEAGNAFSTVVKQGVVPYKWLSKMSDAVARWQAGKNLDEMARIITDPRSEVLLSRLAALPRGSPQSVPITARLVAIGESARQPTKEPKEAVK